MKKYFYFIVIFISFIVCFYVSEVLVDEEKPSYIIAQVEAADNPKEDDFPWELFLPAIIRKRAPADIDNDLDDYTENQGDCDDTNTAIHPGASEICGDGVDQDCDGGDLLCPDDIDNDGFYTVGVEIVPGKWESTGTGTTCYWARLDEYQNILDNHFGLAGGTVTILDTDYEVEFNRCGTWVYVEP
ncbi:putative metal-binding motif-containing protein [Thermodesulfobacteriota bacterium]